MDCFSPKVSTSCHYRVGPCTTSVSAQMLHYFKTHLRKWNQSFPRFMRSLGFLKIFLYNIIVNGFIHNPSNGLTQSWSWIHYFYFWALCEIIQRRRHLHICCGFYPTLETYSVPCQVHNHMKSCVGVITFTVPALLCGLFFFSIKQGSFIRKQKC